MRWREPGRAACLYVVPEVMLRRRGPVRAIASIPGSWARGFVPAWVSLGLLGLPSLALGGLAAGALGPFTARVPETIAVVAGARALLDSLAGALIAGAAAMIHMGSVVSGEDE